MSLQSIAATLKLIREWQSNGLKVITIHQNKYFGLAKKFSGIYHALRNWQTFENPVKYKIHVTVSGSIPYKCVFISLPKV